MKIDTSKIPNFDTLPEEAKAAILGMEFADAPDMSQFVAKATFDKKASEAAELTKKLRSKMTEDEQAAAQAAEERSAIMAELETLRADKAIGEYATQFMGLGYSQELAKATAEALHKGDVTTMFKNHSRFIVDREKALKAELLKSTPTPPAGDPDPGMTLKKFREMSAQERYDFSQKHPEEYKNLYGGN